MNILIIIFSLFLFIVQLVNGDDVFALEDSTYLFSIPNKKNWFGAYQYCRNLGMRLIDIPDQNEQSVILYLINQIEDDHYKTAEYWTSGTDLAREGKHVWMSTGKSIKYTFWHNGQPDNLAFGRERERENCIELRFWNQYGWNDHTCSTPKNFICKNETVLESESLIDIRGSFT